MTNEELLNNVRKAYEESKAEINKNFHDYKYYDLYIGYEVCDWLETIIKEYAEESKTLIEYLKTKHDPFEWLCDIIRDQEDTTWSEFGYNANYQMRWEKDHNFNN